MPPVFSSWNKSIDCSQKTQAFRALMGVLSWTVSMSPANVPKNLTFRGSKGQKQCSNTWPSNGGMTRSLRSSSNLRPSSLGYEEILSQNKKRPSPLPLVPSWKLDCPQEHKNTFYVPWQGFHAHALGALAIMLRCWQIQAKLNVLSPKRAIPPAERTHTCG